MKSRIWILNSALALILFAVIIYIISSWFSIGSLPKPTAIKPTSGIESIKKIESKPKDIKLIYEKDIFGTFIPEEPKKAEDLIPELPQPPIPKPIVPEPIPTVQFLEPLPLKITGIIASSNESKSQVSLQDTNSKKTDSYRVGDKILDAYVIRIMPKKAILLRSNGQEETLYLYQEEAQKDIKDLQEISWNQVVEKLSGNSYKINAENFSKRITSFAQFIEMLDITTAFSKGESIGCRIGKLDEKSIGNSIGLLAADIITKIDNISPISTENRIKIYNNIVKSNTSKNVKVEILRGSEKISIDYFIYIKNQYENNNENMIEQKKEEPKKIELPKIAQNKVDPIERDLKKRDRKALAQYGSKNSVLKNL